ncbi:hypothetical protein [Chromobacterium sp. CV08]|uniref:hypothetical protein n=1 Tax=Chromobacterium sp. CV08 TaxID=3133274 RepID=UPI003DAA0ABD
MTTPLNALLAPARALCKIAKDCTTDEYGVDYDTVCTIAVLMVLVGLALEVASFVTGKPFDMVVYATGCSGLLAVITGALRWKPAAVPPTDQKGTTP